MVFVFNGVLGKWVFLLGYFWCEVLFAFISLQVIYVMVQFQYSLMIDVLLEILRDPFPKTRQSQG